MGYLKTRHVVIVLVTAIATTGYAEDASEKKREEFAAPSLTSTWTFSVGGNVSSFDTNVAWSPGGFGGAVIILEDTLGLEGSTDTYRLGAAYRFDRRHSINLSATTVDRSASAVIDDEIDWGDYVFRAQAEIQSSLDISLLALQYRYDFSDSDRLNAGFSAGLSVFSVDAALSGEARLEDHFESEWIEGVVEKADVLAPVPLVGFFLDYALSPRWVIRFDAQVIDLDVSDYAGRMFQTGMAVEYSFTDHFGAGIGMGGMDLEFRATKKGEIFAVNYKVKLIGAYLAWTF